MNHVLVILAVTAAVVYFLWHNFGRKRKGGGGCSAGCDCTADRKDK